MEALTGQIMQTLGLLGATVVGAILLFQKITKGWLENSTGTSVMTLMHTELERMSAQNTVLAQELGKLQTEVVTLNQELRKLTVENQQLHAEVAALTSEVTRLQVLLTSQRNPL